MVIDWLNFSPWTALSGGALIGLASGTLALTLGRIAGISGIVSSLLRRSSATEWQWRLAFIGGLIFAPTVYTIFGELPSSEVNANWGVLVIAGLLVGFGTRMGSGCTSGHGICGLSRLSPRSLAATLTFMGSGFATVWLIRHLLA